MGLKYDMVFWDKISLAFRLTFTLRNNFIQKNISLRKICMQMLDAKNPLF